MVIHVPEDVFGVKQWTCTVEANPNVATFIKELTLRLPEGEDVDFRACGYVQLECPPHHVKFKDFDIEEQFRGDWERFGFFELESVVKEPVQRAYSMANYPEEKRSEETRLNSSHVAISYAVFCLKKKKIHTHEL